MNIDNSYSLFDHVVSALQTVSPYVTGVGITVAALGSAYAPALSQPDFLHGVNLVLPILWAPAIGSAVGCFHKSLTAKELIEVGVCLYLGVSAATAALILGSAQLLSNVL